MGSLTEYKKVDKKTFTKLLKAIIETDNDTFNIMIKGSNQRSDRIGIELESPDPNEEFKIECFIINTKRNGIPENAEKLLNKLLM